MLVLAPSERCFDLARSIELHQLSARPISGRAIAGRVSGLAEFGDRTTWSARFFGMRFSLTTQITHFERPDRFSDVLCQGLFAHFGHSYLFEPVDSASAARTLITDDFFFQSPLGPLGGAFDSLVLRAKMRQVALWRARCIRRAAESQEWRGYLSGQSAQSF